MTENSKSELERKSSLHGMMDEDEAEEDERKEVSLSSTSYTFLSGSQLCCRSGRLMTGECVSAFRSMCVCMCHMFPESGDHRGLTDYLSRCRSEGSLPLSLSLSFSSVTHWLTLSCTAQGHCNTCKVWKVHDTRGSTVSQHFKLLCVCWAARPAWEKVWLQLNTPYIQIKLSISRLNVSFGSNIFTFV